MRVGGGGGVQRLMLVNEIINLNYNFQRGSGFQLKNLIWIFSAPAPEIINLNYNFQRGSGFQLKNLIWIFSAPAPSS